MRLRRQRREDGQSLVEFSMIVTVAMLMLLGMMEFGFIFDHHLSLEYSTREGARVAAALANGGGTVGCGTGQSPNAATVDQQIIAAVQRVVASPGSPIVESRIGQIRIYKADSTGAPSGTSYNTWVYNAGGGPVVDGKALDFSQTGATGYSACSRDNGATPDSVGVSITYTYQMVTPLSAVIGFFGGAGASSIPISDKTVMALNPS